jgi:hypothetical protein
MTAADKSATRAANRPPPWPFFDRTDQPPGGSTVSRVGAVDFRARTCINIEPEHGF